MKTDTTRFKKTVVVRALLTAFCGTATMMVAPHVAAQAPATGLERVEITGSSIRRVDAETALPVQIISKEEIVRTGATSTEELLNSISSLSSSGATANATGAGTATYGLSTISLRGLGEERTLVLVNGRRLATYADGTGAVNVNAIPLAAIERIEVLKDGASAIYGSDAVAGVVNFILARKFQGVEVAAGAGTPTGSGGGQNQKASITAGFGSGDDARLSGVVSASYEKEKALFAKDRSYAKTGINPPFYTAGATGQGNIEGAVIPGAFPKDRVAPFGNSPGTGYGNPLAAANNCAKIQMFEAGKTTRGAPYCAFDSNAFVGLVPDRELFNLSGNIAFKLNSDIELFGDGLYSKSTVLQTYQPSPLRRSFAVGNSRLTDAKVDPSLIIYPSNPNYPTEYLTQQGFTNLIGKPLAITSRVFDFGPRANSDESEQARLVVGARGTVVKQDYEVALATNQNRLNGSVPSGYFSVTDYNKIINDPTNNWNPYAAGGVQSGALADKLQSAKYSGGTLTGRSTSDSFDGRLSGDLFMAPGGQAQYAAGLQMRRDKLVRSPAPALLTGDIAGLGGAAAPVDKSRTVNSIFTELNVPVTKQIELNASVRGDRYNDVGNATSYKTSARWQPNPSVLIRGSLGTGFRAPTLADLWLPQIVGTTEQFTDPATGQTNLQVNGISGGNPDLKPERSKQASVGFVISPVKNFTVGLDWFNIKVRDILATPSAQEVVSRFRAGDAAYRNLVVLDGNDVDTVKTILANTGSANVSGFDVFAAYRHNIGANRLDVGLNGTYMSKFDQTSPGGVLSKKVGTLVEADGTPVIGAETGGVVLRWKHALTFAWTAGNWTTALTQKYTSRYEAGHDLNDERTFVGAQSLYDVNLTFKGIKNLTLGAGVKNVFDKKPATFVPVSNQFQAGYDITQYDPRGRFVYLNATYRFK